MKKIYVKVSFVEFAMDVLNNSSSFDHITIYRSKGIVLLNHVDLSTDVSSIIVIEYRHLGKAGDR